jgi:hypothetical protein
VLLAGINGQQEQQANGTLLQSSNQQQQQQQQHPYTLPSARSGSRLGLPQDQQQQRQATPQQQQPASSPTMLLDVEQHPGVKALLSLVQADRPGGKEAAAVWSDGQTAATILEVRARHTAIHLVKILGTLMCATCHCAHRLILPLFTSVLLVALCVDM